MTRVERLAWMLVFTLVYGWSVWIDGQPLGRIALFTGCILALELLVTIQRRFANAWYKPNRQ